MKQNMNLIGFEKVIHHALNIIGPEIAVHLGEVYKILRANHGCHLLVRFPLFTSTMWSGSDVTELRANEQPGFRSHDLNFPTLPKCQQN